MKRTIYSLTFLLASLGYNAQVGVNTESPSATLDIAGKPTVATIPDGVIAPRVSLANLNTKASIYTTAQTGAIVYVSSIAGTTTASTINVNALGYYYFNGTVWVKMTPAVDLKMIGSNNHVTQDAGVGGIGTSAGTGSNNIAMGSGSLNAITFGNRNIAIGDNTLKNSTISDNNIGIGTNALTLSNSSSNLVAIGSNSLAQNTSGGFLTAVGGNALSSNTTSSFNTAVGSDALKLNTLGANNTALGNSALSANTVSSANTAIGGSALANLVETGFGGNVALGYLAASLLQTGSQNIIIGTRAFNDSKAGSDNVIIGSDAYRYAGAGVTPNGNIIIGRSAAQNLPSGNLNTAIGDIALRVNYPNTRTVAIGNGAGSSPATITGLTAQDNTFLGSNTSISESITTGTISNASAIGSGAVVAQSNSIVLGRTPGVPAGNAIQDKVGIGTTTPTNALHVKTTSDPVKLEGLVADATANNIVVVGADGILKTIPKTNVAPSSADLSNDAWTNNASNTRVELGTTSTGAVRTAGTEVVVTDNGSVGIKTTNPSSTLETKGSIEGNFREITTASTLAADDYHVSFSGSTAAALTLPTQSLSDATASDFRGRKYYIKNNSTSANLTLTATSGQTIRFGGSRVTSNTYILKAGNYATITASGSGWDLDLVSTTTTPANWMLYDTSLDGYINGNSAQIITAPAGTYTTLHKPNDTNKPEVSVSITVPPQTEYTQNRVVVSFIGWGDAYVSLLSRGSLRFKIIANGTSTGTVMMTTWSTPISMPSAIRYNFPINYVLNDLAAGTYTYKLEVTREEESTAPSEVRIWTLQGKAEVYVK
ncbi:MAG: hypothetical protein KBS61_07005 [Chryseobacterium sp.]|nr:hypothetical protein [Candidatus Chryseobacterium enterohippi]